MLDSHQLHRFYFEERLSFKQIADRFGVTESAVRYQFQKAGFTPRTKSEAQKIYLENNPHQRKGLPHTKETKELLSRTVEAYWQNNEQKKLESLKKRQDWWSSLSDSEKERRISLMNDGAKQRAGKGGKFENRLAEYLQVNGYVVEQRTNRYTPGYAFQVDLALPEINLLIEVDGPVHYRVVYTEADLIQHQERDAKKNEKIIDGGLDILRVRTSKTTLTEAKCRRVLNKINEIIEFNENKKKGKRGSLFIIEVD